MTKVSKEANELALQKSREFMHNCLKMTKQENAEPPREDPPRAKRARRAEPVEAQPAEPVEGQPSAAPPAKGARGGTTGTTRLAPKAKAQSKDKSEEAEEKNKLEEAEEKKKPEVKNKLKEAKEKKQLKETEEKKKVEEKKEAEEKKKKEAEENPKQNSDALSQHSVEESDEEGLLPPIAVKKEVVDSAIDKIGKSHAASHAQFMRALQPAGARASRAPKCPEHIARRIKSEPPAAVRAWFDLYMECGQDWGQLDLLITMAWREKTSRKGGKRWMTRVDLMGKYGQDAKTVDTIIQLELKDPTMWKPNPDCPTLDSATLYKCWDFETETELAETETAGELSLSTSVGQNQARSIVPSIADLGLAKNMPYAISGSPQPSASRAAQQTTDDKDEQERKKLQEAEKEKKRKEAEAEKERKFICPAQKRSGGLLALTRSSAMSWPRSRKSQTVQLVLNSKISIRIALESRRQHLQK